MKIEEITFELTNFCDRGCPYCSSNVINDISDKNVKFLPISEIKKHLRGNTFEHIILSGGEPLSHPNFYEIFKLCEKYTDDIVVYSNLIRHRVYNANAIDGVYLEANLTLLPEVDKIHILRRVKQGKEKNRPQVHLSRNYFVNCSCDHRVIIPDGTITLTPCNKSSKKFTENKYNNKYYICGAHGVGKSTIINNLSNHIKINIYENNTNNPHKTDVFKRQLWRLLKYVYDDENIRNNQNLIITSRCCLDWLVYTETFMELNWITKDQYKILIEKFDEFFNNKVPINIIYINPNIDWSKERIKERWNKNQVKWRESDFNYYNTLRINYDKIFKETRKIENITEINETNKLDRIKIIKSVIK